MLRQRVAGWPGPAARFEGSMISATRGKRNSPRQQPGAAFLQASTALAQHRQRRLVRAEYAVGLVGLAPLQPAFALGAGLAAEAGLQQPVTHVGMTGEDLI